MIRKIEQILTLREISKKALKIKIQLSSFITYRKYIKDTSIDNTITNTSAFSLKRIEIKTVKVKLLLGLKRIQKVNNYTRFN